MLIHEFSSFFHESSLQVLWLLASGLVKLCLTSIHFWICLETSEVFKEDELSVCKGRKGSWGKGRKRRSSPRMSKRSPSLFGSGFGEQREVELTSGKTPGEKSVHLPHRSRLGLKLSLIYRKQRNLIFLVLPEFADWDSYSWQYLVNLWKPPNPFCKETVYKQSREEKHYYMERMWVLEADLSLFYFRPLIFPLDFSNCFPAVLAGPTLAPLTASFTQLSELSFANADQLGSLPCLKFPVKSLFTLRIKFKSTRTFVIGFCKPHLLKAPPIPTQNWPSSNSVPLVILQMHHLPLLIWFLRHHKVFPWTSSYYLRTLPVTGSSRQPSPTLLSPCTLGVVSLLCVPRAS